MATTTKQKAKQQPPAPHSDLLKWVYTDKSGNHYYEFINDVDIPHKRYINLQVTDKMVRLGLSEQALREIIAAGKKVATDGSKTADQLRIDILTIVANIEGRLGFLAGHKVYENYASMFYLLEGEPLVPSDHWHIKKCDIWANDPEARDFFLHGAFSKLHGLTSLLLEDMLLSFKAAEVREQNLPTLP